MAALWGGICTGAIIGPSDSMASLTWQHLRISWLISEPGLMAAQRRQHPAGQRCTGHYGHYGIGKLRSSSKDYRTRSVCHRLRIRSVSQLSRKYEYEVPKARQSPSCSLMPRRLPQSRCWRRVQRFFVILPNSRVA